MSEKLLIDFLTEYRTFFSGIESSLWAIVIIFGAFTGSFMTFLGFYIYSKLKN